MHRLPTPSHIPQARHHHAACARPLAALGDTHTPATTSHEARAPHRRGGRGVRLVGLLLLLVRAAGQGGWGDRACGTHATPCPTPNPAARPLRPSAPASSRPRRSSSSSSSSSLWTGLFLHASTCGFLFPFANSSSRRTARPAPSPHAPPPPPRPPRLPPKNATKEVRGHKHHHYFSLAPCGQDSIRSSFDYERWLGLVHRPFDRQQPQERSRDQGTSRTCTGDIR